MKNNLIPGCLLLFLLTVNLLTAQVIPQNPPPESKPATPTEEKLKPQLKRDLSKPVHHSFMPRRQTVISLERFDEDIDLDSKLKTANEMLY